MVKLMFRYVALRACASAVIVAMMAFPVTALALGDEVHPTTGGGELPAVAETTPVAGLDTTPAPGAQPAAPGAMPAAVATPAVETPVHDPAERSTPIDDAPAAAEPIAAVPDTVPAPIPMANGGGTDGIDVAPTTASANPTGSGELPFTGTMETILLILLAGMFVPIGVLLYCWAKRGDRILHLAAPRFQWRDE